jgi:signal transduction histidine kinase
MTAPWARPPAPEARAKRRRALRLGLRGRLTVLLGLAVLLTLLLAWFLTGRAVLEPFARDVARARVAQVVFLAQEVASGADARSIGSRMGLVARRVRRLPRPVRRGLRRGGRCREHLVRGRRVVACRGRRGFVAVELDAGWLATRRQIDFDAPARRIPFVLAAVGGVVLFLSYLIAGRVTRTLRASVGAMERMAAGDLATRLPEAGAAVGEVGRAFNRMADRVSRLLEAERTLMASISHELRTPLARLRLELELLRDQPVPDKRLSAMEADVAHIDRLIGEVLESSRLSIGERKLAFERLALREAVEEALGVEPLPDHDIRLEGEGGEVWADRARLVRVIRNLLENARKYAPKETEVQIRLDRRAATISDRGPGVPPSELPRLFEPFYRAEGSRGAAGFGLGLMIAKQVIELHGGTLEAENRPGGGLSVRLTLPPPPPADRE